MNLTKKISNNTQLERTISADIEKAFIPKKEEEIKPKLVRPRNLEAHFKQILAEKRYGFDDEVDNENRELKSAVKHLSHGNLKSRSDWKNEKNRSSMDVKGLSRTKSNPIKSTENIADGYEVEKYPPSGKVAAQPQKPLLPPCEYSDDDDPDDRFRYRENLTDKQKYRESLAMEKQRKVREREQVVGKPREHHHRHVDNDGYTGHSRGDSHLHTHYPDGNSMDRKAYRQKIKVPANFNDLEFQRNPYKEVESLPYRESIERMIKSPAMRYKSFESGNINTGQSYEYEGRRSPLLTMPSFDNEPFHHHSHGRPASHHARRDRDYSHSPPVVYDVDDHHPQSQQQRHHLSRHRYRQPQQRSMSRSPEMRISPNGRLNGPDKDKFHSVERDLAYSMEKVSHSRRLDADTLGAHSGSNSGRNLIHHRPHHEPDYDYNSSEEEDYRSQQQHGRGNDGDNRSKEHFEKNPNARISSSKSLGNLVKGYRHSYADPLPRNSGRVGLAAVNPF